jgi:hypothetical protein
MRKKHISVGALQCPCPLKCSIFDTDISTVLNLLFVEQTEYSRKGAGRLMVEFGNRMADAMMLPIWVEASKQGRGLYASCGYELVEQVQLETVHNTWDVADLSYPLMRRPVKVSVQ